MIIVSYSRQTYLMVQMMLILLRLLFSVGWKVFRTWPFSRWFTQCYSLCLAQ